MRKMLIVCGAGASSTFLAHRVRREAQRRGLDIDVLAGSQNTVQRMPDGVDVLLIGPHLSGYAAELRAQAEARGAAFAVLPEDVFGPRGESEALDLALRADRTVHDPSASNERLLVAERTVVIASPHGLHARPAAYFTQLVTKSGVPVKIAKGEAAAVDASSILSVISLGINTGDTVVLTAEGERAEAVLDELVGVLGSDLDAI